MRCPWVGAAHFTAPLTVPQQYRKLGPMKATFEIPDELYREVKAETAREGRTVREVAITLFQQWLRQKKQVPSSAPAVDWLGFQAPLSHLMPEEFTDHYTETMRQSITRDWNEPA